MQLRSIFHVLNIAVIEFYNSGYIVHRNRKKGIIWSGQNAEHVMQEYLTLPKLHPFTHVKIQQLAKKVDHWEHRKGARHEGLVKDYASGITVLIIADIHPTFILLITAVRQ